MLVGRETECRHLLDLLDRARGGTSGVLLIRGEAGIGKSTLLDDVVAAAGDMTLLRVRGVESEGELPYAALHRLVRPTLHALAKLPARQADALRRALSMAPERGTDRFLISVAVLGLLDALGADRPVLCVVDDAHWLDAASAQVLTFVARRLLAESVVMVFAVRDPAARELVADDLPQLRLGALDAAATARLLAAHSGAALHPDVVGQLLSATGGNPLALVELARELDVAQLTGAAPLPTPLPVTTGVEQAFLDQVRRLPDPTQVLLLIAAAEEIGLLSTIAAAARAMGVDAAGLAPAERAGIVRMADGRLEFRHPLVRSAVYQGAAFTDRQAVHGALAEVLDRYRDADRRVWHRAAAVTEPDPEVALELAETAGRAQATGAFTAAAAALRRSAELTTDPEERAGRLVRAGENLWRDGRGDQAAPLLRQARASAATPALQIEIGRLLGLIALGGGDHASAYRILRSAAESVAVHDPARALDLVVLAVEAASFGADPGDMATLAQLAARLDGGTGARGRFLVRVLVGLAHQFAGDVTAAIGPLREAIGLAEDLTEPTLLIAAHRAAFYLGDDAAERRFSASLVALARDRADIGVLPLAAARLAVSEMLAGHWAASGATATEVVQLARATRQEHLAGPGLVQLGLLAALRGEDEACRRYTEQACTVARRPTVILEDASRWALAVLDLARGDPGQAVNRLRGLTHPMVLVMSGLDRVEAASLSGAADLARSWADELVDHARQVVQPWTCARAAHAQALVGPAAEVDLHFAQALAHHEAANRPFEHGRTELAYGVALRRARRRAAARSHLRAAFDRFDALGAAPWAERAQSELRACGQAVSRRVAGGAVDRLTPQEVQVARFVARGLSNAEVAAQLFLSRRTVDFHLRNVFMKLGLTSRTELVRLVAEQVPAVADRAG